VNGALLEDVQRAAGHREPRTTKLYDWCDYNREKSASLVWYILSPSLGSQMPEFQLITEIIARSVAETWDAAKLEWSLLEVYEAEEPETCLCGHFPIIELCVLSNQRNHAQATVGNCCVKRFIGLPSEKIFQGMKRIRKDLAKSLTAEAIQHAFDRRWIGEWEKMFYLDVMRKRNLTVKQAAKKQEINQLVLNRMKRR